MNRASFHIELVSWKSHRFALQAVRRTVFIEEQRVPESEEWDQMDAVCLHALATGSNSEPVGTARLLPDGHIGRMAVLAACRGRGVGAALLRAMIAAGKARGHATFHVNAQTHALGFYSRFGFVAHGPEFLDAGIPHRAMTVRC